MPANGECNLPSRGAAWCHMTDYSLITSGTQFMVIADALAAFVIEFPSCGRSLEHTVGSCRSC